MRTEAALTNIVMRQVVGAILAPTDAEEEKQVEIPLYP